MSKPETQAETVLLRGCLKEDREAQRKLYQLYYGYAMSICFRFSKDVEEAREVLNDGFLKVFTRLRQYDLVRWRHLLRLQHFLDLQPEKKKAW